MQLNSSMEENFRVSASSSGLAVEVLAVVLAGVGLTDAILITLAKRQ
jgi:hypothetical protein